MDCECNPESLKEKMMKKVMFVFVLVLVASTCFAQLQSGPSNTVGYVKISCGANPAPGIQTVSTAFGLPFQFWYVPSAGIPTYGVESTKPSDIVGDQLNCGTSSLNADRILRPDNGFAAFRLTSLGCGYTGALETDATWNNRMIPGRNYYYQNRTEAVRFLVLAGQVKNDALYAPSPEAQTMTQGAFNEYSWRDSRSVNRDDLNLLASGFNGGTSALNSDRVVIQDGSGNNFWRRTSDNTWQGVIVTVEPGSAYWNHNRANGGVGTYSYDYDGSGNSLVISPSPRQGDNSGVAKIIPAPAAKVKATARQ
jgi:hypothetical protein